MKNDDLPRVEPSVVASDGLDLPRKPQRDSSPRWQPIETAPKDGRKIRLRRTGDETTYVGQWFDRNGWATHPWTWHMKPAEWAWMPLPDPPKGQS